MFRTYFFFLFFFKIKENLAIDDREEAEHPDEEQAELSDTETDYQLVSDKMAELNALKVIFFLFYFFILFFIHNFFLLFCTC